MESKVLRKVVPFMCNSDPKVRCDKCGGMHRGECGRTLPAFRIE